MCNDCQIALVDELEPPPIEDVDKTENEGESNEILAEWPLLANVRNVIEFVPLKNYLETEKIPYTVKGRGSSDMMTVFTGVPSFGLDVCVPAKYYARAMDFVASEVERETPDDQSDDPSVADDEIPVISKSNQQKAGIAHILVGILLVSFVLGLVGIILWW